MLFHLIITRFSINTKLAGRMRRKDADDGYLKYRMRLFETFCLPSLRAQTNKNFKWFVLFGMDTPDWFRIILDEYEKNKDFIPIYAHCFADAQVMIQDWVDINCKTGDQLITTRLDNDDAISCHLVEYIQGLCNDEMDLYYFCPRNGQQVTVRSNNPNEWCYYRMGYPANPFVSMLERLNGRPAKMIYHCKHGSIKRKNVGAPVKALTYFPGWMQILHGKNLGNGLWTRRKSAANYEEFPFLKEYYDFGLPPKLKVE